MARIILLEDDDVFRETLIQVLSKAGHSVRAATNGFDGVALLRAEPADLVLTDIVMPHGGLPTIRVLRADFPKLPIVAMSGSHVRLDMAGSVGANRMLSKPFTGEQLLEAIKQVLAAGGS
jgi:CheY-like chemotaxis protein